MLKQKLSLQDYIYKYNQIISIAVNMSMEDQVHLFLKGLLPKTRVFVGSQKPNNVTEAIEKAMFFDAFNFPKKDEPKKLHVKTATMKKEERNRKNGRGLKRNNSC